MCPELVEGHSIAMCPELVEGHYADPAPGFQCGAVLAGVKAKPSGWPFAGSGPALTPAPGDAFKANAGSRRGNGCGGVWAGVGRGGRLADFDPVFPYFIGKTACLEHVFEYNGGMELGDPTATTRDPRSRLDEALDTFDNSLAELITTVDTGGLDHLSAEEKVAVWQRFETLRNRQPLIDHRLIADAEAKHLSEEYCSSTMNQFLIRVLQLSPGDAAARIRAAAALGPRTTMLGEKLDPVLPQLAALQREGVVSTEKVPIVERAMHQLSRHDLDPEAVRPPSSCSPTTPSSWRRRSCAGSPTPSSMPPTPTGRNPLMISCNRTAGIWS